MLIKNWNTCWLLILQLNLFCISLPLLCNDEQESATSEVQDSQSTSEPKQDAEPPIYPDVSQETSPTLSESSEQKQTTFKKNDFKALDTSLKHVSIARGGNNPLMVGINNKGVVKYDGDKWADLEKKELLQVEIAGDGTIWGIDDKKQVWKKDDAQWILVKNSQLDQLSIGNKNEIWGLLKTTVYRKINDVDATPAWRAFPGEALFVSAGGNGDVWVIGAQDATLYRLYRPAGRWEVIIKPGDQALGAPQKICVADQFNVAFLDFQGKIWKLIPGKKGTHGTDWRMVSDVSFTHFSIGYDGAMVALDASGKLFWYKPSEEEKKELEQARGAEIQTNQVVTISSLWDGRNVWTHGSSLYDPNGTNVPPNNHLELLVGPTDDTRQYIGSFFMLTLSGMSGKNQDTKQINFGDEIEIYSLYAALGLPKKSGLLGKDWKWWAHNPHAQLGKSWCDIAVSLLSYPGTNQGGQRFAVTSPYGLTGPIRKNDTIQITSMLYQRNIFVRKASRFNTKMYELVVPATATKDKETEIKELFGSGETAGAQLFSIKPVVQKEVPKVALAAYAQVIGKKIEPSGMQSTFKKETLHTKLTNGIGVISQINNLTAFPLQTSAGDIKAGAIKYLKKTGVEGFANQQLARVASPDLLGAPLNNVFKITGVGQEIITNSFESGTLVKLKKLWSKGIAWINESLATPGSATVMFFARANDDGNIQIRFGEKISPNDIFRVIIGGWKNSKSAIVVDDKIITEVKADINPFAKAYPGKVLPYWVSMHDNFVMVGAGTPGTNIILASYVPYSQKPSRIGFSSHEQPVDYTEIIVGSPFVIQPTGVVYPQKAETLTIPADQGKSVWAETPLRVFNTGTISFQTAAPHTVTLTLDNNQQESYRIEFGANNNTTAHIVKNGQTVYSVNLDSIEFAKLSTAKSSTFWVSIDAGRITVGQGAIGSNVFMIWEDPSPINDVSRVGFIGTNFVQTIQNIVQAPVVTLQELKQKFEYTRQSRPIRQFKGPMILVHPFEYQLVQDGPRVSFKDMDDEKSPLVSALATPMQNGRYPFTITIAANGKPEIKGLGPLDAPAKLAFELAAQVLSIGGDAIFYYAPLVGQAAKVTDAIGAIPLIGEAGVVIKNIAAVAATTAIASAGVAAKTASALAKAKVEHGFRAHDSYVRAEEVKSEASGASQVPKQAIRNEAAVTQLLLDAAELKPNIQQDFEQLVAQYQEIVRRINHPYVLRNVTTKNSLINGISRLSEAYKAYSQQLGQQLMNLLINAVTNPYLKNLPEAAQWTRTMSELIKNYLLKFPDQSLELPPLQGEYLWLPFEFAQPDQGGLRFEVKGQSDLFICFSQDQFASKNITNQVYEVLLGGWENTRHEIHIAPLGRAACALNKEQNSQTMFSLQKFTKYSITLNKGTIKIFYGDNTEAPILSWKDPFAWSDIRFIGVSSWNNPLVLRNLKLLTAEGVLIEDTAQEQKLKEKAQEIKQRSTFTEDIKNWEKDMKYRPVRPENLDQYYRAPQGSLPIILPPSLSEPVQPLPPVKQKTNK